jgi:hypothetical protein
VGDEGKRGDGRVCGILFVAMTALLACDSLNPTCTKACERNSTELSFAPSDTGACEHVRGQPPLNRHSHIIIIIIMSLSSSLVPSQSSSSWIIGRQKPEPLWESVHHSRKVKERIHHTSFLAVLHSLRPPISFYLSLNRSSTVPIPIPLTLTLTLTLTPDPEHAPFSSELSFSPAETHDSEAPLPEVPSHPNMPASCRGKIAAIRIEGGGEGGEIQEGRWDSCRQG